IDLAKAEASLATYNKQTPMDVDELNSKLGTTKTENTTVAKVVDGVPIPVGFAYVEGTKKDTGLIIVDGYGNEFVWVPVNTTTSWTQPGIEPSDGNGTTDSINSDFELMKESVNTYKGFYVGRYETSYNGTRVASVGNVTPLYQTQVIDGNVRTTWYTFYTKQKELHPNNSSNTTGVVSGMIYRGQWDAIKEWMKDVPNNDSSITDETKKFYTKNSTGMGWYADNYKGNPEHLTGLDLNGGKNKVFNIYDLAGNYCEWTQQAIFDDYRVLRGGHYFTFGWNNPMSGSYAKDFYPLDSNNYLSSRLQLYIK
ncbi:MAG: hypothetical protein IKT41_02500, partial [Clostridia bacterium]|nr:hypothetical protein [Clostridia bacterium]